MEKANPDQSLEPNKNEISLIERATEIIADAKRIFTPKIFKAFVLAASLYVENPEALEAASRPVRPEVSAEEVASSTVEAKEEEERKLPPVSGFENGSGFTNEQVLEILAKMPACLTDGVKSIKYEDDLKTGESKVMKDADKFHTEAVTQFPECDITFYKCPNGRTKLDMAQTMTHECAHVFNVKASDEMSEENYMKFLTMVTKRTFASNHFRSEYVDNIVKKEFESRKVLEYWATVCAAYFCGEYDLLPAEDKELVRFAISQSDPEFIKDFEIHARGGSGEETPTRRVRSGTGMFDGAGSGGSEVTSGGMKVISVRGRRGSTAPVQRTATSRPGYQPPRTTIQPGSWVNPLTGQTVTPPGQGFSPYSPFKIYR